YARYELEHVAERPVESGEEGRHRAGEPDSRPVPARRATHRRLLELRARVQDRGTDRAWRVGPRAGHEHGARADDRAAAAGEGAWREQADHHDHRRRADGLAGGRALGLRLAAAARGDPADAARSEALRARRRADERLHALG